MSDERQVKSEDEAEFFAVAERLCETADPVERQRIKEELARRTFGCQGGVRAHLKIRRYKQLSISAKVCNFSPGGT